MSQSLPTDKQARKNMPMARGLLDYFPNALAAVSEVSRVANEQHNPGQEMHWSWGKSNDHADCIVRHLADRGGFDPDDNLRHSAKNAWRALALLEEELVAAGATPGRGVKGYEPQAPKVPALRCDNCGSSRAWDGNPHPGAQCDEYYCNGTLQEVPGRG